MKLGITGLPLSGKSTVFAALTGARGEKGGQVSSTDPRVATVTVLDERIDYLADLYKPKKTTYARIEYLLPSEIPGPIPSKSEGGILNQVRACDALLQVVRNFKSPGSQPPTPEKDFWEAEEEMILSDLAVAEKRLERLELDKKRGKKQEGNECVLIKSCLEILGKGEPLRNNENLADEPALKGFTFLSAKPLLIILNNDDEDEVLPAWDKKPQGSELIAVRAKLEKDIASMSHEEAEEFLEAYHIEESALDRVIKSSYRLLNRISFFTVGSDEVKAWPIRADTPAVEAAGAVHSDIAKGFIRAETLSFEDLKKYGSFQEAKKAGVVRLEGKDYRVRDGDIINFRFNL